METQVKNTAVFIAPGAGTRAFALGGEFRLKLGAAHTDGALCLGEVIVPPGGGPPPHVHSSEDELFYVLEGILDVQVGTKTARAEAGTLAYLPRGIVHRFGNSTDQPTRFLALATSAVFADFIEQLSLLTQPPDFQRLDVLPLAARYGIEMRPEHALACLGPNALGQTGLVSGPGEGAETRYQGGQVRVKLLSDDTSGLLSVGEAIIPPGGGPPAHFHTGFAEVFVVLEGEFVFCADGQVYAASPGATLYVPRGVIHRFRNVGSVPGRLLAFLTPAGFEQFFFRVGALEAAGTLTPEALISLGQELDSHLVPDPHPL